MIEIYHLNNSLNVFEKLINFDESERYVSQNGRTFVVSLDELWTSFIGINFVMGYHKLPTLQSYWGKRNLSASANYVADVMTRDKLKEFLSNPHFSNNEEALPREHPDYDGVFKVRWLVDYLKNFP